MGLYLCVFSDDDEIEGVEVGAYSDFNFFRDAITATVEKGVAGSVCPVLINHSDCDGQWSVDDANNLLLELKTVEAYLRQCPPVELNSQWKIDVAKTFGIKVNSLFDCFFDVDGEPLIERLRDLVEASIANNSPIIFQ